MVVEVADCVMNLQPSLPGEAEAKFIAQELRVPPEPKDYRGCFLCFVGCAGGLAAIPSSAPT